MTTTTTGGTSLTEVERRLVDHVVRGEPLDLAGGRAIDEAAMRSWDRGRTVRAAVLRDILLGRLAPEPDPLGLRLRGARVAGLLDLRNLTTGVALELSGCLLGDGVAARDAQVPSLRLRQCRLERPGEPPLDAERLTTAVLDLSGSTVRARCSTGAVRLGGAQLGTLDCTGTSILNEEGPALEADRLNVEREAALRDGFVAVGAGEDTGTVQLVGARLGVLDCSAAMISNPRGPAVEADRIQVVEELVLAERFTAVGAGDLGAFGLIGAHLGRLTCAGATIRNDSGMALAADSLRVDDGVFLRDGFTAAGAGVAGAIRLVNAHLGALDCVGACISNPTGPALTGDGLRVDHELLLLKSELTGGGEAGAVRLLGATIGSLDCMGTTIRNDSGPALAADRLRADFDVRLNHGFAATGSGPNASVRVTGAQAQGQLDCSGASIRNDTGPALRADGVQVGDNLILANGFEAVGTGDVVGVLDLSEARVGRVLCFDPARVENAAGSEALVAVDGLTYSGLPEAIAPREWLRLLRKATPSYAAQPYQHLAAAQRAAGHDGEARRVLMAQRRDQVDRGALTGRGERAWARLTGLTLGYGYQPWRALLGLLAVTIVAVILALTLGAAGAVARATPRPGEPTTCSAVERVGVGLDLGLPLIRTATSTACEVTATTAGHALTVAGWALQLLAWGFATLFVAGFTGAVRKT